MLNAGKPVPLGGEAFGLAALTTPNASVAGEDLNPLVGEDTGALLQRDAARRMLRRAGLTDAVDVEWLAGPRSVGPDAGYLDEIPRTLLVGSDTELEQFVGVVSGEQGLWGVAVMVARVTPNDHVIAAGGVRRPVGTADVDVAKVWPKDYLTRAAEFAAESMSSLEAVDGGG